MNRRQIGNRLGAMALIGAMFTTQSYAACSAAFSEPRHEMLVKNQLENGEAMASELARVISLEHNSQTVLLLVKNREILQSIAPTVVKALEAALRYEGNEFDWLIVGKLEGKSDTSIVRIYTSGVATSEFKDADMSRISNQILSTLCEDLELMEEIVRQLENED